MIPSWMRRGWPLWVLALLAVASPAAAQQDYLIGNDDVLAISVWLHPELERSVTVNKDGNIVFPPVGEVKAAGLTAKQLGESIADRLSAYLRQTATVTVTVTQHMSRSVLVSGAVSQPGRYGFATLPSLLEVLNQAGGPLPTADLSRVQVVRREGGQLRTLVADLAHAMATGSETGLPSLVVGDVIVVPAAVAGAATTADGVGVLGEVTNPGLYPVGNGLDLWMVLAQAGGPTPRGNLARIKVLTRNQDVAEAVSVNLLETLRRGNKNPYIVRTGDIVFLDSKTSIWEGFISLLAVTTDIVSLIVLSDALNNP